MRRFPDETTMAGYSGTPLVTKLGIKPGSRVAFDEPPASFPATLGAIPDGVNLDPADGQPLDLIVAFTRTRGDLAGRFGALAARLAPAGMLWVAWPKKASGVPTDLNENVVREVGLGAGLVDTKVCAIDDVWSGLKFVTRLSDRPSKRR
jgi:hypothetical protein